MQVVTFDSIHSCSCLIEFYMDKGIFRSPATEAPSLATTLDQRIKASDSGLIVTEVIVPNPPSSSEFILGPCFRDESPSELVPFYPLEKGEKLLLHSLEPEWNEGRTWKSWPNPSRTWINWVDRMEKVKGEKWKTAGIYDAIQLSKIDIPFDRNLLCASLCFWSISSNSFHFNFGMMGPTVQDIVALTGLRPHGEDISAIHYAPKLNFTLSKGENGKRSSNYDEFIEANMKRGDITEDEHISFLIMWLCKYVFCHASARVTKEWSQLAIALAEGKKLALAPFVLSHLYRGCRDLVIKRFGHAGGPFWILQLWLQSYFPECGPLIYDSQNCPTYGVSLAQGKLKHKSFQECFKFFYSCSSRTPSQFTPFSSRALGPEWLRFSLHHRCRRANKQELSDIWSSYLIARDLHYGLSVDKSITSKAGVEYYAPNQFARQFGMTQAVPLPPCWLSANTSSLGTTVFYSVNDIQNVDSRFVQLKEKFSAVHFDANPKCTPSFESWWSNYIGKTRTKSAEEILDGIFPDFQLRASLMQGEKKMKTENSEYVTQVAEERATKKRKNIDSISQQQKFEGHKTYERRSKKAERERFRFLDDLAEFFANNMPKPAINITNQSPAVHGSIHSSAGTVNHQKSIADVVVVDDASSSSDEDAVPLSSWLKSRSEAAIGGGSSGDHSEIGGEEQFFAQVIEQLQLAQTSGVDVQLPALKKSQYSANVLNKTEAEVHRLLMMPLNEAVLPEHHSTIMAALTRYAASPHISFEKQLALEELKKNLPSLSSDFHRAKQQQEECNSKANKKMFLTDQLTKRQELYNGLEHDCSEIDNSMYSIKGRIAELKAFLKEAKMKQRATEELKSNCQKECSVISAELEELGVEFLDSEKEQADSQISQAEASWTNYKQKIIGLRV